MSLLHDNKRREELISAEAAPPLGLFFHPTLMDALLTEDSYRRIQPVMAYAVTETLVSHSIHLFTGKTLL